MPFDASKDRTPYTPEQVATAETMAELVRGTWRIRGVGDVLVIPATEEPSDGPLGEAWALMVGETTWMTTLPPDLIDHTPVLMEARGHFLTTGLGLGLAVLLAEANPAVTSITVVEADARVRRLVEPLVAPRVSKPFRIVDADAETWQPDARFGFVWLDHSNDPIPAETLDRYRAHADRVECWYEERARLKAQWQSQPGKPAATP